LEGETMRFKCLDSKALILKRRKELVTSLVAAAVVTAAGFAIGSAPLASAQDLSRRSSAAEAAFLKENDAAMTKMMIDMAVKPTGDVDHDFVAMMTPHHQGAIDMSEAELRYGHNEQLLRIAQDIVVEELQGTRFLFTRTSGQCAPVPQDGAVLPCRERCRDDEDDE
jgi:Domain of unknown function (DUF305)